MRSYPISDEELQPGFEGFCVRASIEDDPAAAEDMVEAAIGERLGPGWRIRRFGRQCDDFDVTSLVGGLTVEEAWTRTWALRDDARLADAEPLFTFPVSEQSLGLRADFLFGGEDEHLCGTEDPEWSAKQVRAPQAWALAEAYERPLGGGIRVGHPDTGYRRHPEIADPRLRTDLGWDFVDDDNNPLDPLIDNGLLLHPGHGTATASVIFSTVGLPYTAGEKFVAGIAPEAELVPYRVAKSLVILSARNLKAAIHRAIDDELHVVCVGLGGLGSRALHGAIREAVRQGIIVLAAAGNYLPFVIWPAAYPEVVAVAANNVDRQPWGGSGRGRRVDVAAPGESVWRARSRKVSGGVVQFDVGRDSGTSYAAATVAGAAALWLTFHGRETLIGSLGRENLAAVFQQLVRSYGSDAPGHWDPAYGAGILNLEKLLSARVRLPVQAAEAAAFADPFEPFRTLLDELSEDQLRWRLGALLGGNLKNLETRLKAVGDEVVFHVATDRGLRDGLARPPEDFGLKAADESVRKLSESRGLPRRRVPRLAPPRAGRRRRELPTS